MFAIDPAAGTPPYAQVREQLAARIRDGSLPVGTRLPPVRALAAELDLAPNTVARAYRELEAAGLIDTQGRRGTFVKAPSEALRRAGDAARTYAAAVATLGVTPEEALGLVAAALSTATPRCDPDRATDLRSGA